MAKPTFSYYWETNVHRTTLDGMAVLHLRLFVRHHNKDHTFICPMRTEYGRYAELVLAPMLSSGLKRALHNVLKPQEGDTADTVIDRAKVLFARILKGSYESKERKEVPLNNTRSMAQLAYYLVHYEHFSQEDLENLQEEDFQDDWIAKSHARSVYQEFSYYDFKEEFRQTYGDAIARLRKIHKNLRSLALRKSRMVKLPEEEG